MVLPKQHQKQFRWVWYSELGKAYEKDSIEDWDDEVKQDLRWLSSLPENRICADCGTTRRNNGKASECWASVNLGVFLCIRCASYHRSLPNTVSRPKSCSMDLWGPDELERMKRVGNDNAIQMYGGTLPNERPNFDASDSEWKNFLIQKYGEDRIYAPSKYRKHNIKPTTRRTSGGAVSIELINFNDEIEQQRHQHQHQQATIQKTGQDITDISQLERDVSWLLSLICEHCAGRRQQRKKYIKTESDTFSSLPEQKNVSIELRAMTTTSTTGSEDGSWIESEFTY